MAFEGSKEVFVNQNSRMTTNRVKPEFDNWCVVELIDFSSPRQVSLSTIYLAFIRLLYSLFHIITLL